MKSNRESSNSLAKLALIAISTIPSLGGCSTNTSRDDFSDARASATAKADSLEGLVSLKGFENRKVVSLGDVSSNRVSLDPRAAYVVEVPHGSFKEVEYSLVEQRFSWGNKDATDDIYIFDVPKNPSQYAVKIEIQNRCDRGSWDEHDGTYFFLINTVEGFRSESAIRCPTVRNFNSQARNHGKLFLVRSEEDGQVFEVPTPRVFISTDRHYVPGYIRHAHDMIIRREPLENL